MNWIRLEGTLDEIRSILDVPGVEYVGRGVTELADGRYRAGAYVQESAIPLIEARGVIVTVLHTQADIQARIEQLRSEQKGNA